MMGSRVDKTNGLLRQGGWRLLLMGDGFVSAVFDFVPDRVGLKIVVGFISIELVGTHGAVFHVRVDGGLGFENLPPVVGLRAMLLSAFF